MIVPIIARPKRYTNLPVIDITTVLATRGIEIVPQNPNRIGLILINALPDGGFGFHPSPNDVFFSSDPIIDGRFSGNLTPID
jgi:hypothetical protein